MNNNDTATIDTMITEGIEDRARLSLTYALTLIRELRLEVDRMKIEMAHQTTLLSQARDAFIELKKEARQAEQKAEDAYP